MQIAQPKSGSVSREDSTQLLRARLVRRDPDPEDAIGREVQEPARCSLPAVRLELEADYRDVTVELWIDTVVREKRVVFRRLLEESAQAARERQSQARSISHSVR